MILVFAGKRVGHELLQYLIARGDPIGFVVISSDADFDIARTCADAELPCTTFESVDAGALRRPGGYDWLLDLWSPHILSNEILELARNRANLHPSLVPHARGADSTAWCIRKGLPAGVSILEMTEVVDGGGLYTQKKVEFDFPTAGRELHARLQDEMISFFKEVWPQMLAGEIRAKPQPEGGSHHRRKETNLDRVRDSSTVMTLGEAVRWMLAHDFDPGTTAELLENGERYRIRVSVEKVK